VTPRWLPRVLKRIRELVRAQGRLHPEGPPGARRAGVGLDHEDGCELLVSLTAEDSAGRLASAVTGEWLYVFKPELVGAVLYVKLILRSDCIVVSFHEDTGGHEEDA
jgi:hypothetical protein